MGKIGTRKTNHKNKKRSSLKLPTTQMGGGDRFADLVLANTDKKQVQSNFFGKLVDKIADANISADDIYNYLVTQFTIPTFLSTSGADRHSPDEIYVNIIEPYFLKPFDVRNVRQQSKTWSSNVTAISGIQLAILYNRWDIINKLQSQLNRTEIKSTLVLGINGVDGSSNIQYTTPFDLVLTGGYYNIDGSYFSILATPVQTQNLTELQNIYNWLYNLNQTYYCDTKENLQEKYTFYETIRSMYKSLLPIKLVNTDGDTFCIKFDSEHNSHQSGTIINTGIQSVSDQLFTQNQELSSYFMVNNADYAGADKSNINALIDSANDAAIRIVSPKPEVDGEVEPEVEVDGEAEPEAEPEEDEYNFKFNPDSYNYPRVPIISKSDAAGGAKKYPEEAESDDETDAEIKTRFLGGGSSNIIELGDLLIQLADALITPLKRDQNAESQEKITYLENIKVRTANTLNELFKLTSLRDETASAQNQIQKIKTDHSILTAPSPAEVPSPAEGPSPAEVPGPAAEEPVPGPAAEEPVPSPSPTPAPSPQCNDGSSSNLAIPIASGEQKWFKVKSTGKIFVVRVPSE